jgi:hypothetical protein
VAVHTGGEERFRWAQKSAAQAERDGFCSTNTIRNDLFGLEELLQMETLLPSWTK